MATASVTVDSGRAMVALSRFQLSLQQNEELMTEIGALMLSSIRRTFRDQGVPAGSWAPLSPNTIKRNPRIYGAGHKLLILSGALLNSITYRVRTGGVDIGTTLKYASVHQFGSRDRGVAIGPRTEEQSKAKVDVKARSYFRVAEPLGVGRVRGRAKKIEGPRNASRIGVRAHSRHQNIPPRPYLVFRPEDPARIRGLVIRYVNRAAEQAGLGGAQ